MQNNPKIREVLSQWIGSFEVDAIEAGMERSLNIFHPVRKITISIHMLLAKTLCELPTVQNKAFACNS